MMQTDYLIIGSGVAGLNLALELADMGPVILVTKGNLRESNSFNAQGGIAAVSDPHDSLQNHFKNTWEAGAKHGNKKAIQYLVDQASFAIERLQQLGVVFENEKTQEGGHSFPRIHHTLDVTGKTITEALMHAVKKKKNIIFLEETPCLDLLIKNERCIGVATYSSVRGEIMNIFANYTILASGGAGQVYSKTTNPLVTTGDGYAMAYRAGARLKDMEFVQFHPTALDIQSNPYFLLSETLRGEGAILRNEHGEAFMKRYHQLENLAPRDIVSRAIRQEQKQGQVQLDFRHGSEEFLQARFPNIFAELAKHGLNLAHDLIPVTPVAHYFCGGIEVDLSGRTNIDRLYALGEVACTGVHGANRLASNSLMEAMVFAQPMCEYIKKQTPIVPPVSADVPYEGDPLTYKPKSRQLQDSIKKIMWEKLGIVRTKGGLKEAADMLNSIQAPPEYETKNLLLIAKIVADAALHRPKSLGAHYIHL